MLKQVVVGQFAAEEVYSGVEIWTRDLPNINMEFYRLYSDVHCELRSNFSSVRNLEKNVNTSCKEYVTFSRNVQKIVSPYNCQSSFPIKFRPCASDLLKSS
jgi:hypothetical protein